MGATGGRAGVVARHGRPGAHWFLKQFDFPNASSLEVVEQRCTVLGDDIDLILRIDGNLRR